MKILVTGGAGFIGSHLTDSLIKLGHGCAVIDDLSTGKKQFVNSRAKFYRLDIADDKITSVFIKEKPEVVFHLAAQKSVPFSLKNPLLDAQTNIIGSLNVIENSLAVKVRKFIFISTGGAIYGQTSLIPSPEKTPAIPDSPYGLAKLTIDNYLANYYAKVKKLNYTSLRLANVYGPRQDPLGEAGVIAIFINNLLNNKPCYINGAGRQTRDFIYVKDVVAAGLKALERGQGIYNIGTGRETSINDLYQLISGQLKVKLAASHRPAVAGEVNRSVLNFTKAKKELNWSPAINLNQGVKQTIDYFQQQLKK